MLNQSFIFMAVLKLREPSHCFHELDVFLKEMLSFFPISTFENSSNACLDLFLDWSKLNPQASNKEVID